MTAMTNEVHVITPDQFDVATAQTPGSQRSAAISPALGIASRIWGGIFEVEPGARTGVHHHGDQETICIRPFRRLRDPLGRAGRIPSARPNRRLHPRPRLPAPHGKQSVKTAAVSLGRRAQHADPDRRQLAR
jgi:hypothetical protein